MASELTDRSQTLVAISRAKHESHVFTHSHAFCENNGIKTLSELTKNFEYKMTALEALHLRNARATNQEPIHFGSLDIKDYSVAETISKELNQKLFGREYQSILQNKGGQAASHAQSEVVKQEQQQYEKHSTDKFKQQLHAKISEIKLIKEQQTIRYHPFYLDPTEHQTRRRKGRRI